MATLYKTEKNLTKELCCIKLSPYERLLLDKDQENSLLNRIFLKDWREGWFYLAANKIDVERNPTLRYWQNIAYEYLTYLCHLPAEMDFVPLKLPRKEVLEKWALDAPPMSGGEYLSVHMLEKLWNLLNIWVKKDIEKSGGINSFIKNKAPKWNQVGRVCFHLAENKNSSDFPFAFLATYSTGFSQSNKIKYLPLSKALEQYIGENNKKTLIKLLTPVHNAATKCSWVANLIESKQIFKPLAWNEKQAFTLLSSVPILEESGLSIKIPDWWKKRARPQVSVTIDSDNKPKLGLDSMLEFNVKVALGDNELTNEELKQIINHGTGLVCIRGQWIEVDSEKLKEAIEHWENLKRNHPDGGISFIEGMRLLAKAPIDLQEDEELQEESYWTHVSAGEKLKQTLQLLRDPTKISNKFDVKGLQATLRPYQKVGVDWLYLLSELGLGACLADDMGLGKTIQILSLLLLQKQKSKNNSLNPSLLILPASLLGNWKREATSFAPSLDLFFLHSSELDRNTFLEFAKNPKKYLQGVHLVITTYSMIARYEMLSDVIWNLIVLDEAQAIKNYSTKQSKAIRKLKSKARITLTGTPIENGLLDLWSLFDFLNPGLLGSVTRFKLFIKSLENQKGRYDSLRKLVNPYILRRMKNDPKIISDLPDKIETSTYCQLTKEQAKYYQSIVDSLKKTLEEIEPKARRGVVLQTILRLKQVCNHPSHYSGEGDYNFSHSGKFRRLAEICTELGLRQNKVL